MDICYANSTTVMTDIPLVAISPEHHAILRIMGYDVEPQDGDRAGTAYISSSDPRSDLADAMDAADLESGGDEDLISCSSLGIDAKVGESVGICRIMQDILNSPAASDLPYIDIQGAFWASKAVRGHIGGWAARIDRQAIRTMNSPATKRP